MYPDKNTNDAFFWCFVILVAIFWLIGIISGVLALLVYYLFLHQVFCLTWYFSMFLVCWLAYFWLNCGEIDWNGWQLPLCFCIMLLILSIVIFAIIFGVNLFFNLFQNIWQIVNFTSLLTVIIYFLCPFLWPVFMIVLGLIIRPDEK